MRVVVTGGRDFIGRAFLNAKLDGVHRKHGITRLIQGGGGGADRMAVEWGRLNEIPISTYPGEWDQLAYAAGPIRNAYMLIDSEPDVVIAFKGSRNTQDCIDKARAMGIRVWETWK